jgi:hypothetical protein
MRICKTCCIEKPANDFYRDSRAASGRRPYCKLCERGHRARNLNRQKERPTVASRREFDDRRFNTSPPVVDPLANRFLLLPRASA